VVVIYMGLKHAGVIAAAMLAAGRSPSEPVAIVADATTPRQRVVETTLAGLPGEAAKVEPPAIICVGRTVLLRQALDWQGGVRDLDPLGTRARSETA
jgi:uroporphyrin-III C-methyltransferase